MVLQNSQFFFRIASAYFSFQGLKLGNQEPQRENFGWKLGPFCSKQLQNRGYFQGSRDVSVQKSQHYFELNLQYFQLIFQSKQKLLLPPFASHFPCYQFNFSFSVKQHVNQVCWSLLCFRVWVEVLCLSHRLEKSSDLSCLSF